MESEAIEKGSSGAGYRAITIEDLPAIRRAIRRVGSQEFKASDVLMHLPDNLREELHVRELGRAMISRGLVDKVGIDAGACVMKARPLKGW